MYLAPETVLERPVSCAVDIWACGVILYLLLVSIGTDTVVKRTAMQFKPKSLDISISSSAYFGLAAAIFQRCLKDLFHIGFQHSDLRHMKTASELVCFSFSHCVLMAS